MHFFVRSLEAREVMCPFPPGLTGSGAAQRSSCCVCSQQEDETLLPEMMIMRQDFGDGFLTHGLHRDAVGQAVFLVRAGLVESKAVKERLMGLRSHDHERVRHGLFDGGGGEVPQDRPVAAVMGQELSSTSSVVTSVTRPSDRITVTTLAYHWSLRLAIATQ